MSNIDKIVNDYASLLPDEAWVVFQRNEGEPHYLVVVNDPEDVIDGEECEGLVAEFTSCGGAWILGASASFAGALDRAARAWEELVKRYPELAEEK